MKYLLLDEMDTIQAGDEYWQADPELNWPSAGRWEIVPGNRVGRKYHGGGMLRRPLRTEVTYRELQDGETILEGDKRWNGEKNVPVTKELFYTKYNAKTDSRNPVYRPNPGANSMWLVNAESRVDCVRISPDGNGFFIPGQEPCWTFGHIKKWIREIKE